MTRPDFQDYCRELESEGIGDLLYNLLLNIVKQVASGYPPQIYSINRSWDDDAYGEVRNAYAVELIEKGKLEHFFLTQETTQGLENILRADLRHFLSNRKARSEYFNIRGRVKKILNEDERFGTNDKQKDTRFSFWGLAGWNDKLVAQQRDEVLEAMFAVELPPLVKYRADSMKLSPLLSNPALANFLGMTFIKLDKYASLDMLMDGLRYRLDLLETSLVDIDESVEALGQAIPDAYAELIADQLDVHELVSASEIADDLFARLTDRQRQIFALQQKLSSSHLGGNQRPYSHIQKYRRE